MKGSFFISLSFCNYHTLYTGSIICYDIPKVANGIIILSALRTEGSTAQIDCNDNFKLHGSHTLTCHNNGSWGGGGSCGEL